MMAVEINTDTEDLYGPETVVSEHTNRPIDETSLEGSPVFWCEVCQVRLKSAHNAIQHVGGKPHRGRVAARTNKLTKGNQKEGLKRKLDADSVKVQQSPDPANKKAKPAVEADQITKCEDCNLTFNSPLMAIQHFKGKRHTALIAAKLEAKKTQGNKWPAPVRGGGNPRGRGRGGSGDRGRSDMSSSGGFGNFGGGGFGRGTAAGQLVRALKNFYDQTPNNSFNNAGFNSWGNASNNSPFNDVKEEGYFSNNYSPSGYGPKERSGSKEFFSSSTLSSYSQGSQRDLFDNDPPRMNRFSTSSLSQSNNRFSGSGSTPSNNRFSGNNSGGYYSRDYYRK